MQPGFSEFGGLGCVDRNVLRAVIVGVLASWLGSQRFCVDVSPPCHLVLGEFFFLCCLMRKWCGRLGYWIIDTLFLGRGARPPNLIECWRPQILLPKLSLLVCGCYVSDTG